VTVTLATLRDEGLWTGTALRLPVQTSTEEAIEIGAFLGDLHDSMQWAIGDYILACETLFGHEAYQVIESLRISEESRNQYVRVAQAIPPERRRNELTWSHHRAVYVLPPEGADALLEQAVANSWSKSELEAYKRGDENLGWRVNIKALMEVAHAIVDDARPSDNGAWEVDGHLIQRLGVVISDA
jgi:hypothetical protein